MAASEQTQTGVRGADVASANGVPQRTLGSEKVPYEVLRLIPEESAQHYQLVPLAVADGVLEVGMVDPDNMAGVDALNFITRKTGTPYKLFRISPDDFKQVLNMYQGLGGEVDEALTDLRTERAAEAAATEAKPQQDLGAMEGDNSLLDLNDPAIKLSGDEAAGSAAGSIREDAPAIKLVSTILRYAIDGKSSDVHIEPTSDGVRVRYRVDGALHTSVVLPKNTHRALIARVKVLASIRLDEQRKPQDGRFAAQISGRKVDFRVSTFPSYYGEKIVIRILDRKQGFIPLDELGLSAEDLANVREAINKPHGLILVSGPTGSGKSTTLYSMLSELDRETHNVLSLEDPIEYNVDGITQSQVRPEIGYTFANGLRTTLRQDPDIIMVGEIRDGETAKLAMQAALTGHLVLSTIHTNSAVGTIPRLIDMGIEPYMIPPTLILSMAQRLVRQLCPDSGKPVPVSDSMRNMMEKQFATLPEQYHPEIPDTVWEAESTSACPNGTKGRLAVFETLPMTSDVEKVILDRAIESNIWSAARSRGMMTMREDAMLKAFDKKIPFSEVNTLSGIMSDDSDDLVVAEDSPVEPAAPTTPDPTATQPKPDHA